MSCENSVQIEPENHFEDNSFLVVNSIISPAETGIWVTVTRSSPIYSSDTQLHENLYVPNAEVSLSNGDEFIFLDLHVVDSIEFNDRKWPVSRYYVSQNEFPVEPGEEYKLEVRTPGRSKVTASCIIPNRGEVEFMAEAFKIDRNVNFCTSTRNIEERICSMGEVKEYVAKISWSENLSQTYYSANFSSKEINYYLNTDNDNTKGIDIRDVRKTELINKVQSEDGIFSAYSLLWAQIDQEPLNIEFEINFTLHTLDQTLYNYLSQYEGYSIEGFNPILFDPPLLYSNIEGGFGIFGGYNKQVKNFSVKF